MQVNTGKATIKSALSSALSIKTISEQLVVAKTGGVREVQLKEGWAVVAG